MQVEVSNPPLFEELRPLFQQMYSAERNKAANWLIGDASAAAVMERYFEIQRAETHHMHPTPAPYEGSDDDDNVSERIIKKVPVYLSPLNNVTI